MKKSMKRVFLYVTLFAVLFLLTGCKEKNPYVGTWYNSSDLSEMLVMTEDKTFSDGGFGGTYSYTDNQMIFSYGAWGTEVAEISKVDGETCLIQSNNHIWLKGYETAENYAAKRKERLYKQIVDELPAKYVPYELLEDKGWLFNLELQLNENGTYEYVHNSAYDDSSINKSRSEDWQVGRWELTMNTFETGDSIYFQLMLFPEESRFIDYKIKGNVEEVSYNWDNVLPRILENRYVALNAEGDVFIRATAIGSGMYKKE